MQPFSPLHEALHRAEYFERKRERPPEALWELRERSGLGGGRFLPARSEILGLLCVLLNLLSNKGRPKLMSSRFLCFLYYKSYYLNTH